MALGDLCFCLRSSFRDGEVLADDKQNEPMDLEHADGLRFRFDGGACGGGRRGGVQEENEVG